MQHDPHRTVRQSSMARRWHYAPAMASLRFVGFATALASLGSIVSGCSDTGAHLTFSAPDGPAAAAAFQVVLATPEKVPTIQGQRIQVGDNATQAVSYFLQRTTAGATAMNVDELDGFSVRIAPDSSVDTQFIPFVLVYDARETIVGIGTYRGSDTLTPSPILVVDDEIDKYKLDIETVVLVGDSDAPAPGQVQLVECARDDQTTFVSGIVWRPLRGGELRIVLPVDGTSDATGRELDLDCDNHAVTPESSRPDCDDTRSTYHRDAEDICDGYDTNCDNAQTVASVCTSTDLCFDQNTSMSTAIELCDDTTGESLGCHAPASCLCETGTGCITCAMPYLDSSTTPGIVRPCQPALGVLSTYGKCSAQLPCTVELVAVRNGWKIEIAANETSGFSTSRIFDVTDSILVKAKRPEGTSYEQMGGPNTNLTDVDLALITETSTGTSTHVMSFRLNTDESSLGKTDIATCAEPAPITCYP